MEEWVSYYENVMGFKQMIHFDDDDISTEYSALMSKVMTNGSVLSFRLTNQQTERESHKFKSI